MPARKWLRDIENDSHVSTAAAAAGIAPPGFRVVMVTVDPGTGMGDDTQGWALQQYQPITVGHLWWKHKVQRWVTVDRLGMWHSHPDKDAKKELLTRAWGTFLAEMRGTE